MKNSPLTEQVPFVWGIYFTNAVVSEDSAKREAVVGPGQILISNSELRKVLSGIFILLRSRLEQSGLNEQDNL